MGTTNGRRAAWASEWAVLGHQALVWLVSTRRAEQHASDPASPAPATDPDEVAAGLAAARERFEESLQDDNPFAVLAANAGLTLAESEVLALGASCELDGSAQRMLAYLQHDVGAPRLAFDTINRAFSTDHPGALVLGPAGVLRRCALVSVLADGPWSDHRVVVHPTVMWALLGDGGHDEDLPLDVAMVEVDEPAGAALVTVSGPDRMRRRQQAALTGLGTRFLVSGHLDDDAAWAAVVREATITGSGVIVELDGTLPQIGRRWIEKAPHLAWALSSPHELPVAELPARRWAAVDVAATEPTDAEWQATLGDAPRDHRLNLEQLEIVGRAYEAYGGDLDAAVRRLVSGRLEKLARRIRPTRVWSDLVLSPERTALLQSIVDRYRHADQVYGEWGFQATPSRGLVALFSGPSGTGKTMATEIVAGELGLDVFKLDLSSVVSKYIGETEKNLEEVFDAASAGNLLLFFDEADSLFGKRSEVKDARDRYANIEVSYLLQRLEAYDGLVVMATNFERNVDDAFLRRIHTRIEFVLPGVAERRAIWDRNLPATAPVKDVDTAWLAEQFELSGGSIRNAAIHAAFVAASLKAPLTMECAVVGVARELRKLGRLLKPADFGEYAAAIAVELGRS